MSRYADVCVHRLLAAAINVAPLPVHLSSKSYLHDLCDNMNRRHRSAQLAGRASVNLHTLIFFSGDGAKVEEAYVMDVETAEMAEPSCKVMIPRYGIEGRVSIPVASDDPLMVREPSSHRLKYCANGVETTIQVFDKVKVKIWVREEHDHQRELILELVEPAFDSKAVKRELGDDERDSQGKKKKLRK
jgi:exosome complex exonuclease DIS3/RRP44